MNGNYRQQQFFVFDPEGKGMMYFDTVAERDAAAKEVILEHFCDYEGWSRKVVNVVSGVVTASAQRCSDGMRRHKPPRPRRDNESTYWSSYVKTMCNYKMKPTVMK